jgi:glycosyltransferase involved in cell wall biosynthesis
MVCQRAAGLARATDRGPVDGRFCHSSAITTHAGAVGMDRQSPPPERGAVPSAEVARRVEFADPTANPDRSRPSLLYVLPSAGGGGAERAAVDLLCAMDRRRFRVAVAMITKQGAFLSQLPSDIPIIDLRGRQSYDLRLVWRLARVLHRQRPDVVFSVLRYTNLITLLAARLVGSTARVVVNEQNLPSAEFALFGGGRVKGWFIRKLYPGAARVTAISNGIAEELVSGFAAPRSRVQVIPNPVDLERVRSMGSKPPDHPWFRNGEPILVAAGRLHPQKGFANLIRAFGEVRQTLPCKLVILGEGPLRSELEQLITNLDLASDVQLAGFQENPYTYMAHATAFVLSSLYEGFGNVLVEALALGTPVISTRCPVGPLEILTDAVTGVLVPLFDEHALAQSISAQLITT